MEKAVAIDGIIDEAEYKRAKVKAAFLLKEVNYPDMDKDWAYTDWLYEQAMEVRRDGGAWEKSSDFHKTFANVCRWLAVVENPDVSYLDCKNYMKHKHLLTKAAVINISKHGGGGSSSWGDISHAAEENRDELMRQIDAICPDLVICGGTYEQARDVYKAENNNVLSCGAKYFLVNKTVFLEFSHPARFLVDRKILFAYFKAVYSEILLILEATKERINAAN